MLTTLNVITQQIRTPMSTKVNSIKHELRQIHSFCKILITEESKVHKEISITTKSIKLLCPTLKQWKQLNNYKIEKLTLF